MKKNNAIVIGLLIGITVIVITITCIYIIKTNKFDESTEEKESNSNIVETIEKEEANNIAKEILNKYYKEVFYGHSAPICEKEQYDYRDKEKEKYETNEETYVPSDIFKTKNDLKEYLSTFLSRKLIEKIVNDNDYLEKDNKLYCLVPKKGGLFYNEKNSEYEAIEMSYDYFTGKGTVAYQAAGDDVEKGTNKFKIIKENNNWVLDELEEQI